MVGLAAVACRAFFALRRLGPKAQAARRRTGGRRFAPSARSPKRHEGSRATFVEARPGVFSMTRAKNDLHLIAPLKYFVSNQPKNGDRHVYGARSRFLTKAVMARLDAITWPESQSHDIAVAPTRGRVDVAGKLRSLWQLRQRRPMLRRSCNRCFLRCCHKRSDRPRSGRGRLVRYPCGMVRACATFD